MKESEEPVENLEIENERIECWHVEELTWVFLILFEIEFAIIKK